MKYVKGEYYSVVDSAGIVLASGPLINLKYNIRSDRHMKLVKMDIPYVTFDDKWFFNTKSKNFKIKKSKKKLDYILNLPKECTEEKPNEETWTTVDIYREHDINELDKEVKNLVFALNEVGFQTVSSCCGHDRANLFVDVLFRDFITLEKFVVFIEKNFGSQFILTTWFSHNNENHTCIQLRLMSIDIGQSAYKAADHLAKMLMLWN